VLEVKNKSTDGEINSSTEIYEWKKKDEDEETGDTESIENKYMTCLVWLKIKIKIHS
jgi:hypothetical protein